jgi:UDP-N-acetylglucosamine--N-acetylmuramyl-(pentapeptide) pyrophosphoryl-undecaprenol N-acetylglucosamine transferase
VNRLFLPVAKRVALQFPLSRKLDKGVFVPSLPWTARQTTLLGKREARAHFGLDADRTTILVFGGSQGAAFLNEAMPQAVSLLGDVQVIHLTGKGNAQYVGIPSCVKEFEKEMPIAYAAADAVVCRSGAGTIAELIRYDKPALLIPFPHAADNHQWANGQFLEKVVGGARCLEQCAATPERIAEEVRDVLRMGKRNWKMQETTDFDEVVRRVGGKR